MVTLLRTNAISQNPFSILGATARDDRQRINERADQKSLELDHDLVQKARADLTNPRTRLAVELGWMPGVAPKKAEQLASRLQSEPLSLCNETGLPPLAHANLLAAVFEGVDDTMSVGSVITIIGQVAERLNALTIEDLKRDVNEDRMVAGFPELKSIEQIDHDLAGQKRQIRRALRDGLDRLPTDVIVAAMTALVNRATDSGNRHAPELIEELVDAYEVEAHAFLEKEAENVAKLVEAIRAAAAKKHGALPKLIERLEGVVRNWDRVAQPIQVSAKSRGTDHLPSNQLAFQIRGLAVELFNNHDLVEESKRLTKLLQKVFAEDPQLVERVEQDVDALKSIVESREEWNQQISFQAQLGLLFKETLSISPEGVSWAGDTYPLDRITRVRWGGVSRSVNGIPTGTTYTVGFGDDATEAVVELTRKDVYDEFIAKLWQAVGPRLMTDLVTKLAAGQTIAFGTTHVVDDSVLVRRHKWYGATEPVWLSWSASHVWSADGQFFIGDPKDKKVYASLSYIEMPNTHILEQAIHLAYKRGGLRLSQILQPQ